MQAVGVLTVHAIALVSLQVLAVPEAVHPELTVRHVVETATGSQAIRLVSDPADDTLYYLNQSGTIYRLTIPPQGAASTELLYTSGDTGVSSPQGFAIGGDGNFYVTGNETQEKNTVATVRRGVLLNAGSEEREWTTVARTVPYPRSDIFDHLVNGIAVSPDSEYLFVNSGSRTDHGELQSNGGMFPGLREAPLTAIFLKIPAAGQDIVLPDDPSALEAAGYLFASGLRNSFDPAFSPEGELFSGENSGDRDDSEEINWIRQGRHYGFPWRMGTNDTPQQFPGYDVEADPLVNHNYPAYMNGFFVDDPTFPPSPGGFTDPVVNRGPDANSFRDASGEVQDASDTGGTISTLTAHRSPLGLVFDVEGALGAEFRRDGFITAWTTGNAAGDSATGPFKDPGEDLLHLTFSKVGNAYEVETRRIVRGFNHPVDAAIVGHRIYVLEHGGSGSVWEVTFPAFEPPPFVRGFINLDDALDLSDAITLLFHLFLGGAVPCRDAADSNDDGSLDIADAIYILSYLFQGAAAPPPPFTVCGEDLTVDENDGDLGCDQAPPCP